MMEHFPALAIFIRFPSGELLEFQVTSKETMPDLLHANRANLFLLPYTIGGKLVFGFDGEKLDENTLESIMIKWDELSEELRNLITDLRLRDGNWYWYRGTTLLRFDLVPSIKKGELLFFSPAAGTDYLNIPLGDARLLLSPYTS